MTPATFMGLVSIGVLAMLGWVHARWFPARWSPRAVALSGLLVAIGTLTAHLFWFPAGVAKAFPVQHAINVVAGVILGPVPAALVALVIGLLRNLLGVGTLLAFPGGVVGAFLAGWAYQVTRRVELAVAGEVFGTAVLGALASVPIVTLILGRDVAVLFFVPPFFVSSLAGSVLAYALLRVLERARVLRRDAAGEWVAGPR